MEPSGFRSVLSHMAIRALWKNPGFTVVAVLALALGIGANTAIFSVIDRVLLRPLPYPDSERIMRVQRHFPNGGGPSTSIPRFMAWRQAQAFQSMAMYDFGAVGLGFGTGENPPEISALHVTAAFFDVFAVRPAIGRTFTALEDLPNAGKFAVVTHEFWRDHLAGGSDAVGKTILLGREPYTVLGVMPEGFRFDPPTDVFVPLQADPNSTNQANIWYTAGRLRPGATLEQATAELNVIQAQVRARYPDTTDKTESVGVLPLRVAMSGDSKLPLMILAGAVAFVLLIACANVANLLLARAAGRQREIAIRTAIGASRGQIVRQLLGESMTLAMLGGVAGFLIGIPGVRALLAVSPGNLPRVEDLMGSGWAAMLDWRVLAFTIAVSLLTGVMFGLLPALQVSRIDVNTSLKEASGRAGTGMKQNRVRGALVVSEIALALILLVGAALLIRTFQGLRSVEPGFDATNILTLKTSFTGGRYDRTAQAGRLVHDAVERIEALPGVKAAAATPMLPFEGGLDLPFVIEGRTPAHGKFEGDEDYRFVSPHYFSALRVPLIRGRVFDDRDSVSGPRVAMINAAFARKYWPTGDPLGQRLSIGQGLGAEFADAPREIVGVIGDVREDGLKGDPPAVMYVPEAQLPDPITKLANSVIPMSWVVRTQTDPLRSAQAIAAEFRSIDAQLSATKVKTMERVMADSTASQSFNMLLLTVFAAVALALAAIGIYGVLAYSVQQRTQEIGIRMALGAGRGQMLAMVMGQGMRLAGIGVVIGLAAAYGLTRVLSSVLFGVKANDPVTFAMVAAVLVAVAMVAAFVPAHRATRVDPVIALRNE
jgi:putative ABC transport system permease protein